MRGTLAPARNSTRIVLAATALLMGCTSYDGIYAPACIAYAGDTIRLQDGRFYWDKFTDEVVIGKDREVVDKFPDHPFEGTFRIDGKRVLLISEAGESLDDLYLLVDGERTFLLDVQQYGEWQETGQYPKCALALSKKGDH